MITAEHAIFRLRRDLTISSALRTTLLAGAAIAVLFDAVGPQRHFGGALALGIIGVVWLSLSYMSVKSSRLAAVSASLIASGNFEQAEQQIAEAIQSFSLFRTVKLRSVHHLAMLRHAQRRWYESAILCRTLLGERLGVLRGLSHSASLILADSLLEVGDLPGAYYALAGLYRDRLSLVEAIELTSVQLDYLSRIGAWEQMLVGLAKKIELAELMPSAKAARAQALLALAAMKAGRDDWAQFLRRRAGLLASRDSLVAQRPVLAELWES